MVALVPDEVARNDIDLLRALYDRGQVDKSPPVVPLVEPAELETPLDQMETMLSIILGVFPPFMLELGSPEAFPTPEEHLLQMVASKGADDAQRLASALYRDLFPELEPEEELVELSPLRRTAMTVGRFRHEREATAAATALSSKSYFLVVSEAGILEANEDDEGEHWSLLRSLPLGGGVADGSGLLA